MDNASALASAVRNIPDFPQPGIQFKDITPILADPELLKKAVDALAEPFLNKGVTRVVAIEARGFILGSLLAARLGAGFIPVRKKGKLPFDVLKAEYALEYGTDCVEMHADAVNSTDKVLIHDDVIATGGTAGAAYQLVAGTGAEVVGFSFLIELTFLNGRDRLTPCVPVHAVIPV